MCNWRRRTDCEPFKFMVQGPTITKPHGQNHTQCSWSPKHGGVNTQAATATTKSTNQWLTNLNMNWIQTNLRRPSPDKAQHYCTYRSLVYTSGASFRFQLPSGIRSECGRWWLDILRFMIWGETFWDILRHACFVLWDILRLVENLFNSDVFLVMVSHDETFWDILRHFETFWDHWFWSR